MSSHIFRWFTGGRKHHIFVKSGGGRFWWYVEREEDNGSNKDVANCPAPGFASEPEAIENARAFLSGIGADHLDVRTGKHYTKGSLADCCL